MWTTLPFTLIGLNGRTTSSHTREIAFSMFPRFHSNLPLFVNIVKWRKRLKTLRENINKCSVQSYNIVLLF